MKKKLIYIPFLAVVMIVSCSKKNDTDQPNLTSSTIIDSFGLITIDSNPVFRGTVDGKFYYMSTSLGYMGNNGSSRYTPTGGQGLSRSSYSHSIVNKVETMGIVIGKGILEFQGPKPSDAKFLTLFSKGPVPFQNDSSEDGINIKWFDEESWYSKFGDQIGSTFTIDDVKKDSLGVTIKASISCKLYSADGSRYITVTNGEYVGQFLNW